MSFNIPGIARPLGLLFLFLAFFMLPPAVVSAARHETSALTGLLGAFFILLVLSAFFVSRKPKADQAGGTLYMKDCFLLVSLAWILASVLSSLPYLFSGLFPSLTDCLFEGVSGMTMTGATILSDIDSMPKGLLLWRAETQWLGGLGILVLVLSLLAQLDIGGMQVSRWEGITLISEQRSLHLSDAARLLICIYLVLTAGCMLALLACGIGWFDAVCHSLSTVSAGGFSTHDANLGFFDGIPAVSVVICFFSLLSALNFFLYIHLLRGRYRQILRDSELRFFLALIVLFACMISFNLFASDDLPFTQAASAVSMAVFQSISAASGSGFYRPGLSAFPSMSILLLLILTLIGGCSASVAGGLKAIRALTLVLSVRTNLQTLLHPSAVIPVKMGNNVVSAETVGRVIGFIALYILVFCFGGLLISFDTQDMFSAFSASAACLSGAGTGLWQSETPTCFASFGGFAKIVFCFLMVTGRLEIYAILLLFTPGFWRAKQ